MLLLVPMLCYLCGSIPFGVIVGKLCGVDVRTVGSGNIGATNVWRALGPGPGTLVFLLDVLKGISGPWLGRLLLGPEASAGIALCAFGAVLGHTCSVFLKFKGGKAIATGLGVALGLSWLPALVAFGLWGVVVLCTRMISAGSVAACIAAPVAYWLTGAPIPSLVVITLIAALALLKHRPNIQRIGAGTEPRLNFGKRRAPAPPVTSPTETPDRAARLENRGETATSP